MIVVFVECDTSGAAEVSRETVTFACTLAGRTGAPLHAVVVGDRPDGLLDQLGRYGVAEVHHATGDAVAAYGGATFAAAVQAVVATTGAGVVVAPGTPRGMEVAAHLAARLDVPMAANVVAVGDDGGAGAALRVVRQVVGGSVLEEMVLPQHPAVLTVAGHAVADEPGVPGTATLREYTPEVAEADLVARVVSFEPVEERSPRRGSSSAPVAGRGRRPGSRPRRSWRSCSAGRSGCPGWSPAWAGARTTSRSARPAAASPPTSTSRAASAGPSSTGPAARARGRSWRSTATRPRRWSPRRPTR